MAQLRAVKAKLDKLKQLEAQLDEKDGKIAELSKQVMMQEGAIQGWLDTIDQKKKIIRDKEKRTDQLEAENGALQTKNADLNRRLKTLELDMASANAKIQDKEGEMIGLKRLNESLMAQKEQLERQMRNESKQDKGKDERIASLVKELADERVALNEARTETEEVKDNLERVFKLNGDLAKEKERIVTQL